MPPVTKYNFKDTAARKRKQSEIEEIHEEMAGNDEDQGEKLLKGLNDTLKDIHNFMEQLALKNGTTQEESTAQGFLHLKGTISLPAIHLHCQNPQNQCSFQDNKKRSRVFFLLMRWMQ